MIKNSRKTIIILAIILHLLFLAYLYTLLPALSNITGNNYESWQSYMQEDIKSIDLSVGYDIVNSNTASIYDDIEVNQFIEKFKSMNWRPANKSIYDLTRGAPERRLKLRKAKSEDVMEVYFKYKDLFYGYADINIAGTINRYKTSRENYEWIYEYVNKYTVNNEFKKVFIDSLSKVDLKKDNGSKVTYDDLQTKYIAVQNDLILAQVIIGGLPAAYGAYRIGIGGHYYCTDSVTYSPKGINLYIMINNQIYSLDDAYVNGLVSRQQINELSDKWRRASEIMGYDGGEDYTIDTIVINNKENIDRLTVSYKFGNKGISLEKGLIDSKTINEAVDRFITPEKWQIKGYANEWNIDYNNDTEYFILDLHQSEKIKDLRNFSYIFYFYKQNGNYYCMTAENTGMYTYSITEDQYRDVEAYIFR